MLESLVPLASYCTLMTATPGPNNVMVAASGANFGYRRTLPHILGVVLGTFVLTGVVCLGLGALVLQSPFLHKGFRFVGAAYLVYLAWTLAGARVSAAKHGGRPLRFLEGAAFQLMNPKSWMKAITIATVFMPQGLPAWQAALLASTIGLVIAFPLVSVWTLFGVAIGRFLDSPLRLRIFNAVMALSLVALAVAAIVQP